MTPYPFIQRAFIEGYCMPSGGLCFVVLAVMTAVLLEPTLQVGSGPLGRENKNTTKKRGQEPCPVGRSVGPPKA